VNYTALLSDGTKFEEKQNFQFIYGEEEGLLPSFENAIKSMKKGEKAVFTVAPKYGFGSDGNSSKNVPPNEYIKYEIELVDFEVST
jgi:FKBP-type peptidyl-prolyl cis-trans isomerase